MRAFKSFEFLTSVTLTQTVDGPVITPCQPRLHFPEFQREVAASILYQLYSKDRSSLTCAWSARFLVVSWLELNHASCLRSVIQLQSFRPSGSKLILATKGVLPQRMHVTHAWRHWWFWDIISFQPWYTFIEWDQWLKSFPTKFKNVPCSKIHQQRFPRGGDVSLTRWQHRFET